MILACTEGKTNTEVAKEIRTTKQTVGKLRSRFFTLRTDGLFDEPRPGAPRRGGGRTSYRPAQSISKTKHSNSAAEFLAKL
jgi:transposase